jgi:hypothetical protein
VSSEKVGQREPGILAAEMGVFRHQFNELGRGKSAAAEFDYWGHVLRRSNLDSPT